MSFFPRTLGSPGVPWWRDPESGGVEGRAGALLWAHLDETQRAQYAQDFSFEVVTRYLGGATTWRVAPYWLRVIRVEGRSLRGRFRILPLPIGDNLCVEPREYVPAADIALAKKLMLESRRGRRYLIRHGHFL